MPFQLRCIIAALFCLFVIEPVISQTKPLFYQAPHSPKITNSFTKLLRNSPAAKSYKAWIFLTDKQIQDQNELKRALQNMRYQLSERALERREKVRTAGNLVDHRDLPVSKVYVDKILATGAKQRNLSNWFNAVSIEATAAQLAEIARLSFVREIRPVLSGKRQLTSLLPAEKSAASHHRPAKTAQHRSRDYGPSLEQLKQINVPPLHELGFDGSGVLVAMLDAGFFKSHTAFRNANVIAEHDFVFDDDDTETDVNDPNDSSDNHGTLTWSTLGGAVDGELYGPAFGASFILAKTEDTRSETPIEEDNYVAALEWVESMGADVVSSSLGYFLFDDGSGYSFDDLDGNTALTTRAADHAAALGVVIVTAAGNQRGNPTWPYIITPSDGDSVIAVGAVDANGNLAGFSSPGPTADGRIKPDVAARGIATHCAGRPTPTTFVNANGTSLSTPLVGGVAAILLQAHPDWTPIQVRDALRNTASQSDHPDNDFGWGIIDAFSAADLGIPWITIGEFEIDDDNEGASLGNGNGLAEPGEVLEISVSISNISDVEVTNVNGTIHSQSQSVALVDSAESVGEVSAMTDLRLTSAFVVEIDSSLAGAVEVVLTLELTSDFSIPWTADLQFTAARFSLVDGTIKDAASNLPIANATTIVFGPLDESLTPDTVMFVPADQAGRFTAVLLPGDYAIAAVADGYVQSDAQVIELPGRIDDFEFALTAPAVQVEPNALLVDIGPGFVIEETMTISNAGSGNLFASLMEVSRATKSTPVGPYQSFKLGDTFSLEIPEFRNQAIKRPQPLQQSPEASDWQPIGRDADDGIRFDLQRISVRHTDESLFVRVTGHHSWGQPTDWVIAVFLDTDHNVTTGIQITPAIGAEFALVGGVLGNVLLESTGQGLQFAGVLNHTVVSTDSLELGVPLNDIGLSIDDGQRVNMIASILQGTDPNQLIQWDVLPDQNTPSFLQYSLVDVPWLNVEPRWATVSGGQSQGIKVTIDATALDEGRFQGIIGIGSNSVNGQLRSIPVQIDVSTSVADNPSQTTPETFALQPGFPNPLNLHGHSGAVAGTRIEYQLPAAATVKIEVYNVLGQKIRTLLERNKPAGFHMIEWDGRRADGGLVTSGVYFYRMEAKDFVAQHKVLVVR